MFNVSVTRRISIRAWAGMNADASLFKDSLTAAYLDLGL
jgi:hypothetical protein